MANRSQMRAGDDDRDRVAEILREAHGEGRLGQEELLERVEATYAARTYRDLDRIIEDLPVARRPTAAVARQFQAGPPARRLTARRVARGFLNASWWVYASVVAMCVVIWLLTAADGGGFENFWPIWVAGPWGVVLGVGELAYRSKQSSPRG